MRKVEYLSPTSIAKFEESVDDFYLWYLVEKRPPKVPQTQPMSVGSAFDAFVKSYLHQNLFGKGKDPRFDLIALFEAQVEQRNRDFAYGAGKHCFEVYQKCGALSDLMIHLSSAVGEPRFELEVRGVINGYREGVTMTREGVVLLGKPDVFFINAHGAHVVIDWKVSGYCSDYGASPLPGYVSIRNDPKQNDQHRDACPMMMNGIMVNIATYLEYYRSDWATQLAIYGWLCGEEIGHEFIVGIDQLACRHGSIRVAQHRTRVSAAYQWKVFARAQQIWEIVHSNHIFRDLSPEDSKARCELLDKQAEILCQDGDERDRWFAQVTRGM